MIKKIIIAITALIFVSFLSFAETPKNFSSAKRMAREIFSDDRVTLYCGCKYDKYNKVDLKSCGMQSANNKKRAHRIEWEHIMPAENFGRHFKCWREKVCQKHNGKPYKGRSCCEKIDPKFKRAESELYNLWPAVGLVNGARSNYQYAAIPTHNKHYGCNFQIENRKVQPDGWVKGLVARASLFMSDKYHVKLSKSQRKLFLAWDKQYPPTQREINWSKKVQAIEGYGNSYIKGGSTNQKSLGKTEALPPAYLNVDNFKSCLSTKSMGTWDSYCLPKQKLKKCSTKSWLKLSKMDIPAC